MPRGKTTIRRRWGVQGWWKAEGNRPGYWATLGHGWIRDSELPPSVDYWPASYLTRREARAAVRLLTERAHKHSPHWRFREVALRIAVTEIERDDRR